MHSLDYLIIILYLVGLTVLSLVLTRKTSSTKDYLLGGGKTPWWAAALTYLMALTSTLSLVSIPGEAYNNGLRLFLVGLMGPFMAIIFFHIFIKFYFRTQTFTPFKYLEQRFDNHIRTVIGSIYLFSRIVYLAIVLFSCSIIFVGAADWKPWTGILLIGGVSLVFTILGGFKAVVWTNVVQFVILTGGLLAAVIVCILYVNGGFFGVFSYAFENGRGFNVLSEKDFFSFDPHVRITFWIMLFSATLMYMFYCSADQMAIQPLLSTGSLKKARRSFLSSIIMFLPLTAVFYFLGLAMFAYYGQHPDPAGNPSGDTALFRFMTNMMPTPIPGLVVSGMLAAAISTVASGYSAISSVITKDFYLRLFKPDATEIQQVRFSRKATLLAGIVAIIMALMVVFTSSRLGETVIEAGAIWGSISALIPVIFFIAVMCPRCNSNHALGALIAGFIVMVATIIWYSYSKLTGNPISFMMLQIPCSITVILYGTIVPWLFGTMPSNDKIENLTIWTMNKSDVSKNGYVN